MKQQKTTKPTTPLLHRLIQDESGTVAPIFGASLIALAAIVGGAVDYGRWVSANKQTSLAVDAAVLAATRAAQAAKVAGDSDAVASDKAVAAGTAYYQKNKSTLIVDTTAVQIVKDAVTMDWKVTGTEGVNTPFLHLIGIEKLGITPKASATVALGGAGSSSLEISLMLDITGSMCADSVGPCTGGTKMTALKTAAKDLINTVVWDNQTSTGATSRVALVPFSTRIRVGADGSVAGSDMMKKVTNLNATWTGWYNDCIQSSGGGGSEGNGNWTCTKYKANKKTNWKIMPCVVDRFLDTQWSVGGSVGTTVDQWKASPDGQWNLSDNAPGSNYWLNAHGGDRMPISRDGRDITPTNNATYYTSRKAEQGLTSTDPAAHWNYNANGDCADVGNSNIIMPLTNNKANLTARVDALSAYGATGGPMGTQWAWYMLSPKWKNVWPAASEPAAYSETVAVAGTEPKLKKIAVLMTDGSYNTMRGWKDQDQNRMSAYAIKVCREMKAAGVTVYTVGFGLNELPANERTIAVNALTECSSSSTIDGNIATLTHKFYNAETPAALQAAFNDIALQLTKLRLTQ